LWRLPLVTWPHRVLSILSYLALPAYLALYFKTILHLITGSTSCGSIASIAAAFDDVYRVFPQLQRRARLLPSLVRPLDLFLVGLQTRIRLTPLKLTRLLNATYSESLYYRRQNPPFCWSSVHISHISYQSLPTCLWKGRVYQTWLSERMIYVSVEHRSY
jgi:hypothetical protein